MPPPLDANYPLHTSFPYKKRSEMANECFAANVANILSHMVLCPTCQHTLWLGKYGCRPGVRTNCFAWCLCQMRTMDNRQGCTVAWAGWVSKGNFWACYFQHGVRKKRHSSRATNHMTWIKKTTGVLVALQFPEDDELLQFLKDMHAPKRGNYK